MLQELALVPAHSSAGQSITLRWYACTVSRWYEPPVSASAKLADRRGPGDKLNLKMSRPWAAKGNGVSATSKIDTVVQIYGREGRCQGYWLPGLPLNVRANPHAFLLQNLNHPERQGQLKWAESLWEKKQKNRHKAASLSGYTSMNVWAKPFLKAWAFQFIIESNTSASKGSCISCSEI